MQIDILPMTFLSSSLLVALLLGVLSPIIGMFLVVRRFSLLADTLAHVSLLGVALGLVWQLPFTLGAMTGAVVGGLGIEMLRQSRKVLSEATLAVFLSGSLSVALILFALQNTDSDEIEGYLFGNLASVGMADLVVLGIMTFFVGTFFVWNFRKLFLMALDEELAKVSGISVRWLNALFMLLASLVIAVAIKVVGVLLVSALVVLPVLAAMQWRLGFRQTLVLGVILSEFAAASGYALAYFLVWPSGATIALVALLAFIFSYLIHLRRQK